MKTKLFTLALAALTIGLLGSCKKEDPKVSVTGVTLDKTELTLTVGDPDVKLAATVTPENATDKTVSWSSDKTEFATVDNQGNVHAVAPGTANITVTTTDGGKTATCAVTVKAAIPVGALPGEFSVSATKKVYFSQGNLWADGSNALHFEANQYSSASSWDASHVSHLTWSSTVEAAVGNNSSGDYLFCDESHKVSVDGGEAIYYALSRDEWTYLFHNHSKKWTTVNGMKGCVIAPDGFEGELANSYANDAELVTAGNLVFLPAANFRMSSSIADWSVGGFYWSSTAFTEALLYPEAYYLYFDVDGFYPDDGNTTCGTGHSVRLVTEVK